MNTPIRDLWYGLRFRLARPRKNYVEAAHFYALDDANRAALLFKKSVRFIELEISSYCNRVCAYCPNVFIDRRSAQHYMDDGVFDNLMRALGRIGYAGVIRLHRYNEPLSDRDYAIRRIRQIRAAIPDAVLEIYTNGDYLKHDYVAELRDLGCRKMFVNAHVNWDEYDEQKGWDHLGKLVEKLGFPHHANPATPTEISYTVDVGGGMEFTYAMNNFYGENADGRAVASDRGQSLDIATDYVRTAPCLRPFDELQVEYTGTLAPCCHIRTDVPKH
ncbi:MAG: radical SAM protein, partial [Alphaproteobacteria bacterium]|nr:radical SAM protein [Alphaproteobacteria bacterium]